MRVCTKNNTTHNFYQAVIKQRCYLLAENKKNSNKRNHTISPDKIAVLKELFLMGGITPTQAGLFVGVDFRTVQTYFQEWAEEIVDDPNHITWAEREAHARVRALESITKQIIKVQETLARFEKILDNLLVTKNKETGEFELKEEVFNIENLIFRIINVEKIVRLNRIYHSELQMQYASIEMMPPIAAILEKELEKWIDTKQATIKPTE